MKQIIFISIALFLFTSGFAQKNNSRQVILLEDNWHFINEEVAGAEKPSTSTLNWETVTVPHDWAIKGPFNKEIDKQMVRVRQDLEKEARERTGRTGALPHIGTGWYRKTFELPEFKDRKKALLVFDGAMSDAQVYVNGEKVGNWPFGYNYFYFDISKYVKDGENILAVRLENLPFSSRWYPGAGIYRKVQVIIKDEVSFKQWGTFITTPFVAADVAKVNIKSEINGENVNVVTEIKDADGNTVASKTTNEQFGNQVEQNIAVPSPIIWDIETPYLYTAHSKLFQNNELKDELITRFGIREVVYERGKGLILNGEVTKFKGVCLHHDLGPLGAAVNKAALKRQLTILKDMGCNAVRSSHNMPSHEQLELCDEMGFLFLAESFDEWAKPKVKNGYNRFFEEWAEKDVVNFVRATRNHPSIVMWSSGNEVPDQWGDEGVKRAKWLHSAILPRSPNANDCSGNLTRDHAHPKRGS
ncbi:MAG: hypothetical protein HOA90_18400 [Prolixibacteraceae bacterium]|nr:hypothetical protein [Prolixibacteraceae bacterium]